MKYRAYSTSQAGLGPFYVRGGPFASEQMMGIHVTDERGFTVAVSCHAGFAEEVNEGPLRAAEAERARCRADLCEMCERGLPAEYGPAYAGSGDQPGRYEFWHRQPVGEAWAQAAYPCFASKIRLREMKEAGGA